jgi:2-polyprenyl-6-methoxyphenol hydroxylase-like FAD-dependent oxidoreductase
MQNQKVRQTTCCIVGGGPAGIVLGYLLAHAGVHVTVLEKHGNFFRDFRGDTVHPSTLQVLYELGLLDDFLKIPHQKVTSVGAVVGDIAFPVADFRHLPVHCKFTVLMPQWDFLNFLSERARAFPSFELLMHHEATGLLKDGNRVTGIRALGPNQTDVEITADLVVACDGRHSTMRAAANLDLREFGVPIDVLWFRISRKPTDPEQVLGTMNYGKALILINRNDYFQAGMIIQKGSFSEIQQRGIDDFRRSILQLAPYLVERINELESWDQIRLLTVQINRLRRWYRSGLLCIGDAAHAMSPAGGVGINLAIQDAIFSANVLAQPLRAGRNTDRVLTTVQRRREFPTAVTQAVQVAIHRGFARVFENPGPIHAPWLLKVAVRIPGIHSALGYAVGIGVRPEHPKLPEGARSRRPSRYAVAIGSLVGLAVAFVTLRRRVA